MSARGSIAAAVVQSQREWGRKPFDLYPTPFLGTAALLNYLKLPKDTRIIEPACGEGHISRVLASRGYENVQSFDIREDAGYGQGGVDFLQTTGLEADWVITNPPFKDAEAFARHALTITGNVALLLKVSYWSAAARSALRRETKPAERLNLLWRLSFLEHERGSAPIMDTMWVIWREGYDRDFMEDRELPRPPASDVALHLRVWESFDRLRYRTQEATNVGLL